MPFPKTKQLSGYSGADCGPSAPHLRRLIERSVLDLDLVARATAT